METAEDIRDAGCGIRLLVGAVSGLGLALVYSAIAAIGLIFGSGREILAEVGVSWVSFIAVYFGVGVFGGVLLGILWPLARTRYGAALIGVLVCTMLFTAMSMIFEPAIPRTDLFSHLKLGFLIAVPTGIASGLYFWEPPASAGGKR